ncbi:FAD-binding protein [bacterium]|nr:FAD-binding protein [bacterium]
MDPVWTNWPRNVVNRPRAFHRPRTQSEIRDIVRRAAASQAHVRVVGGGHSWSEATRCDGELITLDRHQRLLFVDRDAGRFTVEGGLRLAQLNAMLAAHGVALANLGSIDVQSVAGLISTATHGSGIGFGTLSDLVRGLTIVTGDGEIVRIDESDGELLHAAACSLGLFGVVSEVTMECVPAFNVHCVEEMLTVDEVLANLDAYVRDNEHFKFWCLPHTDYALVFRQNRTDEKPRGHRVNRLIHRELVRNYIVDLGLAACAPKPRRVRAFHRLLAAVSPKTIEYVDRSDRVFNFRVRTRHWESEYAVPIEHAREAILARQACVDEHDRDIGFILEVRFVRGDAPWLSPAHGRDSCYLGAFQHHGMPWDDFFHDFEARMGAFDGRPHWGKCHTRTAADFARLYPRWNDFLAVRERFDPRGTFLNDHLRRVIGRAV